jgi:2-dehydro-3-deoxyphosphogalactonate aldolase
MLAEFADTPLVAILRGLNAEEARAVGPILFDAGFRLLEVPLNRPGALDAIATLVRMAPAGTLVGGGTMLTVADVDAVAAAGGCLFVAPDCKPAVIARAHAAGMLCAPGIATPTEAFAALDAGAHALKVFPAEALGIAGVKAMTAVLPHGTAIWPVGGVTPESMPAWRAAGATGFGIGSALYTPGIATELLAARARAFVDTWRRLAGDGQHG